MYIYIMYNICLYMSIHSFKVVQQPSSACNTAIPQSKFNLMIHNSKWIVNDTEQLGIHHCASQYTSIH